jgi:hypothetical protein
MAFKCGQQKLKCCISQRIIIFLLRLSVEKITRKRQQFALGYKVLKQTFKVMSKLALSALPNLGLLETMFYDVRFFIHPNEKQLSNYVC